MEEGTELEKSKQSAAICLDTIRLRACQKRAISSVKGVVMIIYVPIVGERYEIVVFTLS